MQHIEGEILEDDPAGAEAFDPHPSHYRLIVCRPPGDSPDAALARWGLVRGDVGTVFLYLAPCFAQHDHRPPMLLRSWRPGTAPQLLGHERMLQEALALDETQRVLQQQARWEQDRATLRTLGSHKPIAHSP